MTNKALRILHISPSFYPAINYGGPIFSTKAITDGIACTPGLEVEVLTTDTSNPHTRETLNLSDKLVVFPKGYPVRYCKRYLGTLISVELLIRLPAAIWCADVVHLTGPYNFPVLPTLLICRLTGTPLVWSPRGGFQATAQWVGAPRRRVKNIFEKFANLVRPRGTVLHVTAEVEAETSSRNFPGINTALIPNAIEVPDTLPAREWQPGGRLRLAFLSRVHRKKGLDILIPALAALPHHVTLDIYGDGDQDYIEELHRQITVKGLKERVRFNGLVSDDAKIRAFTECDLFVLPTYSENFGIVIGEALAHGTPVVTTVNAPWEGIESEGCGRWIPASPDALVSAITSMDGADLAAMGARGRAWMQRDFSSAGLSRKFETLYRRLAYVD